MVFFTCNACGESLKKAQVDKHVTICRGCQVLSCIDCGKDFWGDDYKNHNKCISEDQKYGGKGYEAKTNKGDVKQQQWIQKIHDAMNKPGINPKLKDVLKQVSSYDNVPRKKAKFQNWMKNSLKIHNASLHDQVWEIFSAATSNVPEKGSEQQQPEQSPVSVPQKNGTGPSEQNTEEENPVKAKKKNKQERKEERQKKKKTREMNENANGDESQPAQNGVEDNSKKQQKKKKRKREEEEEEVEGVEENQNGHASEKKTSKKQKKRKEENSEESQTPEQPKEEEQAEVEGETNTKGKFNWKGTIKAVLRQAPEEGFAVKKLRKKVLAAYYSFSGDDNYRSEEELLSLFNKKLNNNPKFKIIKDKVRLVK